MTTSTLRTRAIGQIYRGRNYRSDNDIISQGDGMNY